MTKIRLLFVSILLLAGIVRLYQLGSFPHGLTWDEAAIGYNAYSIATVHRDEWLKRMPLSFQSFGDYKSPLLIYATSILLLVAPLTPFFVRLPVALSGVGLVIVAFFLTHEIFYKRKDKHIISLFVMFLVAISPWAITLSRVGFESMVSALLVSFGVLCWLFGIRMFDQKDQRLGAFAWIIGDVSLALSLYAYHSAKVVVPLSIALLGTVFFHKFIAQKKSLLIGSFVALCILAPIGYVSIFGNANSRAISTTIIGKPDAVTLFVKNLITQISPQFLLFGSDITYRQSTKEIGVLYATEFVLLLVGIGIMLKNKEWRQFFWIPVLFGIGLLPASLGLDVPHSNRAALALPWAQVTAGIGFLYLYKTITRLWKNPKAVQLIVIGGVVIFTLHLASFLRIYTRVYTSTVALKDFGYGLEEAIQYTRSQESTVDRVYFTNDHSQAYIYLIFFKRMNPIDFRGGGLANYVITENPYNDAKGHARVLVVGTREDIPNTIPPEKVIKYPDGTEAFVIIRQ